MSTPFHDRCNSIRYETTMIRSEAEYMAVIEVHRGTISMGEIDLAAAERSLESALETVRALRMECEEKRHEFAHAA